MDFGKYWKYIEIPVYVLVVWSIISILLQIYVPGSSSGLAFIGPIVTIAVFSYVGFSVIKDGKEIGLAVRAGALGGAISGLVSALLGLIMFYAVPGMYAEAIRQAVEAGAPAETARSFIQIGVYIGLVISPAISALIGAGVSAISAWVVKRN